MIDLVHQRVVRGRRVSVLASQILPLLPEAGSVLDVGTGDGQLAAHLQSLRPSLKFSGVDVLVRPDAVVPVTKFDGIHLPFGDASFNCLLMVDVLHHAEEPDRLFAELCRVARQTIVIKDHLNENGWDAAVLRFMDDVGNRRFGVNLPYHYWSKARWHSAFQKHGIIVSHWCDRVPLYPWWANWFFGRRLHVVCRLQKAEQRGGR